MFNNNMDYQSILFESAAALRLSQDQCNKPEFFTNLNLDQIVDEIVDGKEEYNLKPFFFQSLQDASTVHYRLDIMKELENTEIFSSIAAFSAKMKKIREYTGFSRRVHNAYQREKWLLDAANLYCNSIIDLNRSLTAVHLHSRGLSVFYGWLTDYIRSESFQILSVSTSDLINTFDKIRYSLQLESGKLTVDADTDTQDYCAAINGAFEQFCDVAFDYRIQFFTELEMCELENKILEMVRKSNIDVFEKLDEYAEKHVDFMDTVIMCFDREIQFYVSYQEYIGKLRRRGLEFAYPEVTSEKRLEVTGGYDMALAYKNRDLVMPVVPNDFTMESRERIFILTGPNQGGKTTFARTFGQILFLASIGCPVPCRKARLFLFDRLFTHFSTEESPGSNAGRLKEELIRLNSILKDITTNSIIVLNELFATTTSQDAYTMGKRILEHFISLDCICLYVTHIHELASISDKVISLAATAIPGKDVLRTYKIVRKPADGLAYANTIAEKYDLSFSRIKERIGR
jgi:DNA mismatch repair protein MutS